MQLLLALATGAAALVAPTQRALPKTVRQFNFGDFGKSKDYASAQEKIRSYDNTQTVETTKYGKRAIRATQLNGQNVLNPEPACAALSRSRPRCYLSAQACARGVPFCGAFTPCVVSGSDGRGWFFSILRLGAGAGKFGDVAPSRPSGTGIDLVTGGVLLFVCAVWLNWYGTFRRPRSRRGAGSCHFITPDPTEEDIDTVPNPGLGRARPRRI